MGSRRPNRAYLAASVGAVLIAACSATGVPSSTATPTLPATVAPGAASHSPSAATARPTPQFPTPAELRGTWRSELFEGVVATLTIGETRYELSRLGTGTGRLEAIDGVLVFSRSSLCQGEGRYRWSIDGDQLRLDSVEPDECPGRADSLDGFTYSRVSP